MIHHPKFSITSIEHNLMLIKLSDNIELNDYVKLASLPREPAAENTLCMVSTWAYHVCDICEWHQNQNASLPLPRLASAVLPSEVLSNLFLHPFISFASPRASGQESCNLLFPPLYLSTSLLSYLIDMG